MLSNISYYVCPGSAIGNWLQVLERRPCIGQGRVRADKGRALALHDVPAGISGDFPDLRDELNRGNGLHF